MEITKGIIRCWIVEMGRKYQ